MRAEERQRRVLAHGVLDVELHLLQEHQQGVHVALVPEVHEAAVLELVEAAAAPVGGKQRQELLVAHVIGHDREVEQALVDAHLETDLRHREHLACGQGLRDLDLPQALELGEPAGYELEEERVAGAFAIGRLARLQPPKGLVELLARPALEGELACEVVSGVEQAHLPVTVDDRGLTGEVALVEVHEEAQRAVGDEHRLHLLGALVLNLEDARGGQGGQHAPIEVTHVAEAHREVHPRGHPHLLDEGPGSRDLGVVEDGQGVVDGDLLVDHHVVVLLAVVDQRHRHRAPDAGERARVPSRQGRVTGDVEPYPEVCGARLDVVLVPGVVGDVEVEAPRGRLRRDLEEAVEHPAAKRSGLAQPGPRARAKCAGQHARRGLVEAHDLVAQLAGEPHPRAGLLVDVLGGEVHHVVLAGTIGKLPATVPGIDRQLEFVLHVDRRVLGPEQEGEGERAGGGAGDERLERERRHAPRGLLDAHLDLLRLVALRLVPLRLEHATDDRERLLVGLVVEREPVRLAYEGAEDVEHVGAQDPLAARVLTVAGEAHQVPPDLARGVHEPAACGIGLHALQVVAADHVVDDLRDRGVACRAQLLVLVHAEPVRGHVPVCEHRTHVEPADDVVRALPVPERVVGGQLLLAELDVGAVALPLLPAQLALALAVELPQALLPVGERHRHVVAPVPLPDLRLVEVIEPGVPPVGAPARVDRTPAVAVDGDLVPALVVAGQLAHAHRVVVGAHVDVAGETRVVEAKARDLGLRRGLGRVLDLGGLEHAPPLPEALRPHRRVGHVLGHLCHPRTRTRARARTHVRLKPQGPHPRPRLAHLPATAVWAGLRADKVFPLAFAEVMILPHRGHDAVCAAALPTARPHGRRPIAPRSANIWERSTCP